MQHKAAPYSDAPQAAQFYAGMQENSIESAKKPYQHHGRSVIRAVHSAEVRQFAQKMQTEAAKAIYRQRGAVAEFPHAWIKDKLGLKQFRLRGLTKVRMEVLWAALTYNIQQWVRLSWRTKLQLSTS